jgi:transposase
MIPPAVRRCPSCGHIGRTGGFGAETVGVSRIVVCPACGHRFDPVDQPWRL